MSPFRGFSPDLFRFLTELSQHNDRDWFAANKSRYEEVLLEPALAFVEAFAKPLHAISPHFMAVPKRSGGSLMRIYRDTRFSKNKSPYKTNVGIHFRHEVGKDVHAPGFYLHLQPGECFLGAGIWHPDNEVLTRIREAIDEDSSRWKRVCGGKAIGEHFTREGDSLKRPPRGFDPDHPLIEDLKLKDHLLMHRFEDSMACSERFLGIVRDRFKTTRPFVRFLCEALTLPF